jgi:hypothetical protein
MEFSNDDVEEEKDKLSNELVAALEQKITALEEQGPSYTLQPMTKRMTLVCFIRPPLAS